MAFVAARSTAFKLDNAAGSLTDISAYVDSVSGIANTTDMAETTTFGSTSKTFRAHCATVTRSAFRASGMPH
jgi:hypothetical protein